MGVSHVVLVKGGGYLYAFIEIFLHPRGRPVGLFSHVCSEVLLDIEARVFCHFIGYIIYQWIYRPSFHFDREGKRGGETLREMGVATISSQNTEWVERGGGSAGRPESVAQKTNVREETEIQANHNSTSYDTYLKNR